MQATIVSHPLPKIFPSLFWIFFGEREGKKEKLKLNVVKLNFLS